MTVLTHEDLYILRLPLGPVRGSRTGRAHTSSCVGYMQTHLVLSSTGIHACLIYAITPTAGSMAIRVGT